MEFGDQPQAKFYQKLIAFVIVIALTTQYGNWDQAHTLLYEYIF